MTDKKRIPWPKKRNTQVVRRIRAGPDVVDAQLGFHEITQVRQVVAGQRPVNLELTRRWAIAKNCFPPGPKGREIVLIMRSL